MKLYELSEAYCSVLEELSEPEGDGEDEFDNPFGWLHKDLV